MSQPNLYEVEVNYTIYILANSEREAEQNVVMCLQDEEPDCFAREINNVKDIDFTWKTCIPYAARPREMVDFQDITCEDFLKLEHEENE